MQASDGNFYGTTHNGGQYVDGVVFEVSPAGVFNDLHDFDPSKDGEGPLSPLVQGTNGVLYGTTVSGGTSNAGTIYSILLGGGGFSGSGGSADPAYERNFLYRLRMGRQR
jgi:uncharacterized repeat protein (TIGR03803 family)